MATATLAVLHTCEASGIRHVPTEATEDSLCRHLIEQSEATNSVFFAKYAPSLMDIEIPYPLSRLVSDFNASYKSTRNPHSTFVTFDGRKPALPQCEACESPGHCKEKCKHLFQSTTPGWATTSREIYRKVQASLAIPKI